MFNPFSELKKFFERIWRGLFRSKKQAGVTGPRSVNTGEALCLCITSTLWTAGTLYAVYLALDCAKTWKSWSFLFSILFGPLYIPWGLTCL